MVKSKEIYKCNVCGNVIEVLTPRDGTLVCCGQEMNLLVANSVDASHEVHVPVIKKIEGGYEIEVGKNPHPMEEDHYIEWIEIIAGDRYGRKFLKPKDLPKATFRTDATSVSARIYCNKHLLWKS